MHISELSTGYGVLSQRRKVLMINFVLMVYGFIDTTVQWSACVNNSYEIDRSKLHGCAPCTHKRDCRDFQLEWV